MRLRGNGPDVHRTRGAGIRAGGLRRGTVLVRARFVSGDGIARGARAHHSAVCPPGSFSEGGGAGPGRVLGAVRGPDLVAQGDPVSAGGFRATGTSAQTTAAFGLGAAGAAAAVSRTAPRAGGSGGPIVSGTTHL